MIEEAFRRSIALLRSQGELREKENTTEIVVSGPDGEVVSVTSPFSSKDLQTLSSVGGRRIEDIILDGAFRVVISRKRDQSGIPTKELTLVKFDPGQLRVVPKDAWRIEEIVRRGVQYSVEGQGTPESLTERIRQLVSRPR